MRSSTHRSQNVLRLWYEAICITLFQVTQQGQVAVKYRRNVGSLSINMSADNRTIILGRHIGQHIGRVSVDISTDAPPMLDRYVGRYVDRHISVDISTDSRQRFRWTYRPILDRYVYRYIGRASVDMSTDSSVEGCTKYTWSDVGSQQSLHAPLILFYAAYWSGIQFTIVTISSNKSPLTVNLIFLDSCYLADDLEA